MILGVDYYPEHWPVERWAEDARLMRSLGLQVVRIAEFAWANLEPQEGCYEWAWLDRSIAVLAGAGLQVILGTPTAAAPAWLARAYPETLPVDDQGRRREFGSRRHYCPNSPVYREKTRQIVAAMAERYGGDGRIIGWQIDNEFGGGKTARCYCPACAAAFRAWLQARYASLEALNEAWGAVFWSQTYAGWDQIQPPVLTVAPPNPSHSLDYYRFASDSYVEYQQLQIDLLKAAGGGRQFVTHNFMGLYPDLDHYRLAAGLDFATWDSYPTGNPDRWRPLLYPPEWDAKRNLPVYAYDAGDPIVTGMAHDLTRGLKRGPFWIMEQQCGHINWGQYNPGIRPGTVRLWTWHALASGASGVVYFRWRSTWYAQEQYHSGLLQHDASLGVGYTDVQALQAERHFLEEVAARPYAAPVALLFDYDDLWAIQLQPHRQDFTYLRHLFVFYQALQRLGVNVDIVSSRADLSGYRLVVAPTLHLADDGLAEGLAEYVRSGGALLLGVRTGFKTPTNRVTDRPLPGALSELAGVTVRDWHALPPGVQYDIESSLPGLDGMAGFWAENLAIRLPGEADTLATYCSGPFRGRPALTEHHLGQGRVLYLGWYPSPEQAEALLGHLAGEVGIETIPGLPHGMLAIRRGERVVLLNFTENTLRVDLAGRQVSVPSRDVKVV